MTNASYAVSDVANGVILRKDSPLRYTGVGSTVPGIVGLSLLSA